MGPTAKNSVRRKSPRRMAINGRRDWPCADLLTKQAAYMLNIVMTVIGVGALMILRDPSQTWLLYVYVIFFGIGLGSRAVIFSVLTADLFSGQGFVSILGYSTVAHGVGGALR